MDIKNSDKNKNNEYNFDTFAVEGLSEVTILSELFFSKKNVNLIHIKIINKFKKEFNVNLGKQSENELLIVMRSIYLDNSKNTFNSKNEVKNQLDKLNNRVIEICFNNIKTNYLGHQLYLQRINTDNFTPLNRSEFVSNKGDKTLELKPFF